MTRPLDAFPLIHTSNLEELRVSLASIYAKPILELAGRGNILRAVLNHRQLRHVGFGYGSYGTEVQFQFPESNFVAQLFPIAGKANIAFDGGSLSIDSNHGALISANTPFNMTSNAEYERLILTLSSGGLKAKLAALTGKTTRSQLKMEPLQNFARPSAQALREHFLFFVNRMCTVPSLPDLVLTEFEQTLMVMFLHANRHNYSDLLEQQPTDVAVWQVRRAKEYIEANWDKPISLEAIAAATDVSLRGLFRDFRKISGHSPSDFLKQVRLRHARRRLQRQEAVTTIEDVAYACGFIDIRRFIGAYAQAFGEQPQETLARCGGNGAVRH